MNIAQNIGLAALLISIAMIVWGVIHERRHRFKNSRQRYESRCEESLAWVAYAVGIVVLIVTLCLWAIFGIGISLGRFI